MQYLVGIFLLCASVAASEPTSAAADVQNAVAAESMASDSKDRASAEDAEYKKRESARASAEARVADYKKRQGAFSLTPFETIREAINVKDASVVFLDVRDEKEVAATSEERLAFVTLENPNFVYIPVSGVSAADVEAIKKGARENLPNMTDAIVVYCTNGERAKMATTALLDLGYASAMNMGGFKDLKAMLEYDAMMAMMMTVHDCHCRNHDDCQTNPLWLGLKWCQTTKRCKHADPDNAHPQDSDGAAHNWDWCEARAFVEAGADMCDVWQERGYHSECAVFSLVGLFRSCAFQCNTSWRSWVLALAGVALIAAAFLLTPTASKGKKGKGAKKR